MPYTIENYCLYISIGGMLKKQPVPNLLLQVSIQELHNVMVSTKEEGGRK